MLILNYFYLFEFVWIWILNFILFFRCSKNKRKSTKIEQSSGKNCRDKKPIKIRLITGESAGSNFSYTSGLFWQRICRQAAKPNAQVTPQTRLQKVRKSETKIENEERKKNRKRTEKEKKTERKRVWQARYIYTTWCFESSLSLSWVIYNCTISEVVHVSWPPPQQMLTFCWEFN